MVSLAVLFRRTVRRRILAGSGMPARLLRAGGLLRRPWQGEWLVVARKGGLGDVLMATPLLREAKQRRPGLRTVFHTTTYAVLVRGLPYIDEVLPYETKPAEAIDLSYEDAIPPQAPLAQIFADQVGLRLRDTVPDCVVAIDRVAHFRAAWAALPLPRIVVLRRASRWSPNKDWPDTNWAELLARIGRAATIIEIGEPDTRLAPVAAPYYVDLRGRTALADLPAVIAAAGLLIGPVSGPLHIAAAVGTPSVTINGGYESPRGCAYPTDHMFSTPVPCAPCWRREPCPNDLACLTAITPVQVEAAVWRALEQVGDTPRTADVTDMVSR